MVHIHANELLGLCGSQLGRLVSLGLSLPLCSEYLGLLRQVVSPLERCDVVIGLDHVHPVGGREVHRGQGPIVL